MQLSSVGLECVLSFKTRKSHTLLHSKRLVIWTLIKCAWYFLWYINGFSFS